MLGAAIGMVVGALVYVTGLVLGLSDTGVPNDVAPLVSAGGGVTLAGCVVYIAKLLAQGRLVARDPAVEAEALRKLAGYNAQLAADAHQREADYLDLLREGHQHDGEPAAPRRRPRRD